MCSSTESCFLFKPKKNKHYLHLKGGQILRLALACSALTNTPIKVWKIRAGRQKGGLAAQHLKGKSVCLLQDHTKDNESLTLQALNY